MVAWEATALPLGDTRMAFIVTQTSKKGYLKMKKLTTALIKRCSSHPSPLRMPTNDSALASLAHFVSHRLPACAGARGASCNYQAGLSRFPSTRQCAACSSTAKRGLFEHGSRLADGIWTAAIRLKVVVEDLCSDVIPNYGVLF